MTTDVTRAADGWGMLSSLGSAGLTSADTLGRMAGALLAYAVFTVGQRFLRRSPLLRTIALPLNLLVLALLLLAFLSPALARIHPQVLNGCVAAAAFLGVSTALKLIDVLCFELLAQWRNRPQVPLVVRDIGRWALSLVALVLIVRGFFPGINLNVLAVSSLVIGYIVGNATQDTLGNLVAGLALNTERPFQIGDWVTVGGHTGIVVDTTWRATRLKTKAEDYIVIPNATIAREPIVNFSRPTRNHGCYLSVGVDYETPPNRAREVILGALRDMPEVCAVPPPSVFLASYADFSINFTIKFFIEDYAALDRIQSLVMDRLWYAFKRHGVSIPFPIQDVRVRDAAADTHAAAEGRRHGIRQLLARVDLFQSLSVAELEQLAAGTPTRIFAAGESLCRQGEEGDSFYIIRSGRVAVSVCGAGNAAVVVARLGEGEFFGEMSLLTGERRSATVTAETDTEVLAVSKGDFASILQANAGLAEKLASVIETRATASKAQTDGAAAAAPSPVARSTVVARIRRFFGLG